MDRWIFRITEPGASPRELTVSAGMTFGRREDNACVLKDESTSSRHFAIVDDGGVLAVEDLGSTNGTRLESGAVLKRGNRQRLQAGLKFRAGATSVEVKLAGAGEGAADERTMRSTAPIGRGATAPNAERAEAPSTEGAADDDERTTAAGPLVAGAAGGGPPPPAPPPESESAAEGSSAEPADDERTMVGGPDLLRKGGAVPPPPAPPPAEPPPGVRADDDERTIAGGADALRKAPPPPAPPSPAPAAGEEPPAGPADDEQTIQGVGPLRISSLPSQDLLRNAGAAGEAPAAEKPPPEKETPREPPAAAVEKEEKGSAAEGATLAMPAASKAGSGVDATAAVADESGAPGERSIGDLQPRFVIASPAMRKTVRIKSARFTFGREETADCPIQHGTVSNNHAHVTFDGRDFCIEDRGSKNGTFVGDTRLQEGEKRHIQCGDYVRFAAVPALFITEGENGPSPAEEAAAAAFLVRKRKVTGEQRKQAAEAAKELQRRLGEMLLLDTSLEVSDWVDAVEKARKGGGSAGSNNVLIAVIALLAVIILVLLAVLLW